MLTSPDGARVAAIRLRLKPEVRKSASKMAEGLQRRYDLLFLHLETPKPVRLTAAVRWGISNSKIPARAWKSPVPTQVIEDYLADEPDDPPASPIPGKDWVQVVNKFIPIRDHLDNRPLARSRARSRARSGTSSRASSLSEGHVSPEDDGPSKKVLHYDD